MKILWLKTELLHPVDKGGKIRTYEMLKRLKSKYEVTYLTLAGSTRPRQATKLATEYCHRLITVPFADAPKHSPSFYRDLVVNLGSRLPYAIEKYRSNQMRREIERELQSATYDVVVSDFLVPSINLPFTGRAATILFQHNVESMIWRRHYESQTNPITKTYFKTQWERMLTYERQACNRFDAVVAVSAVDRDFLREHFEVNPVYDVPTGIDTEYFQPLPDVESNNSLEIVFTGSMDWMPNEDAIVHFVRDILPRVASVVPGVTLTVVGRNPSGRVSTLARQYPHVTVTGRVPDIRPYLGRAAVCVVPLKVGGGTRLKIFEAMAMGKPVVSTSIGAEGLPVQDGNELLIADGAERFAHTVIRILRDRNFASRLGREARAAVCDRFGWEKAAAAFGRICESVAANSARVRAA